MLNGRGELTDYFYPGSLQLQDPSGGTPRVNLLADATPAAIRTPAIADGSNELPNVMTPTQVVELKRLAGVEIGGTLKNVYAVGAGLCDGLGLGDMTYLVEVADLVDDVALAA